LTNVVVHIVCLASCLFKQTHVNTCVYDFVVWICVSKHVVLFQPHTNKHVRKPKPKQTTYKTYTCPHLLLCLSLSPTCVLKLKGQRCCVAIVSGRGQMQSSNLYRAPCEYSSDVLIIYSECHPHHWWKMSRAATWWHCRQMQSKCLYKVHCACTSNILRMFLALVHILISILTCKFFSFRDPAEANRRPEVSTP
jgi:hypothetical protein